MTGTLDVDSARAFAIPMRVRFRATSVREGVLVRGPAGWAEFSPFADDRDEVVRAGLAAAIAHSTTRWPQPVRDRVPVYVTVPAVSAEQAYRVAMERPNHTVKVKVGGGALDEDVDRVAAVRDALGPTAEIRVDANGAWDVDTAVDHIRELDKAANGLQFVEQPCRSVAELAAVRRRVTVRIAADESAQSADDLALITTADAADVVVVQCGSLGGVRQALRVVERTGLPCVVSSLLETSVGVAAQLALAGALPELPFACGLATLSFLESDVVPESVSLRPVDGYLPVPRTAPNPDPELLSRYEITGTERGARWRARLSESL